MNWIVLFDNNTLLVPKSNETYTERAIMPSSQVRHALCRNLDHADHGQQKYWNHDQHDRLDRDVSLYHLHHHCGGLRCRRNRCSTIRKTPYWRGRVWLVKKYENVPTLIKIHLTLWSLLYRLWLSQSGPTRDFVFLFEYISPAGSRDCMSSSL